MKTTKSENPPTRRYAAPFAGAALSAFLMLGAPAFAQQAPGAAAPQPTAPAWHAYQSHIDWWNDCVAKPSANASGANWQVYHSHVAWRDDEVMANSAQTSKPKWQQWGLWASHVDHYDACSQHPIVMSSSAPSYSWADLKSFFSRR